MKHQLNYSNQHKHRQNNNNILHNGDKNERQRRTATTASTDEINDDLLLKCRLIFLYIQHITEIKRIL
jgi:hypothetical protein